MHQSSNTNDCSSAGSKAAIRIVADGDQVVRASELRNNKNQNDAAEQQHQTVKCSTTAIRVGAQGDLVVRVSERRNNNNHNDIPKCEHEIPSKHARCEERAIERCKQHHEIQS